MPQNKSYPVQNRSDLEKEGVIEIANNLRELLADVFTLFIKTKNFHWHMRGKHFRDYHLLLDEQSEQLFAMTDVIAERARKLGGATIHSIGEICRLQSLRDNDEENVLPLEMLSELQGDSLELTRTLREIHDICDDFRDVATASLIEVWIDEAERRTWFLSEIVEDLERDSRKEIAA